MAEKRKIPFEILDSIRGIAALYVAIAHCRGILWIGGSEFLKMFPRNTWGAWDYFMFGTSMLTRLAVEFVIVFFVLSGFSIAHSLSSNKSPLQFYKRRFIRIYPSYIVALVFAGLVFLITRYWHPVWYDGSITQFAFVRTIEMNQYFDGDVIAKNLVYMPSHGFITPFWSLTYEVIFYLLAPFILRKINWYAAVSLLLIVINFAFPSFIKLIGDILGIFYNNIISGYLPNWLEIFFRSLKNYLYEFVFVYNIYFATGVFLYKHFDKVYTWCTSFTTSFFLALIAGSLILMYSINFYFKIETVYSFMASALLSVLLITFFLIKKIHIRWLMNIGKFSYTLYITHLASVFLYLGIYWLLFKPSVPYILNFFVWMPAVLFVIVLAFIQYWMVEKRTKTILNRLRSKVPKPELAQTP